MADASGAEAATARRPGGGPAAARRKGPKGAGGGLAPGLARKVRKALELRADDPALLDALHQLTAAVPVYRLDNRRDDSFEDIMALVRAHHAGRASA